ncbi:hypothetical protein PCI56_16970 [Plesiomonas shigelloides subsp. oncorhynchi]|nr:hypothetical protein [Plesiomonas shigelloides]
MMPLQRTGSRRWWLGCVMSTLVALPMSRALADVPVLFQVREEVISRGYQMPIAGPYPAQVIPADCEQYLQHNQFDVLGSIRCILPLIAASLIRAIRRSCAVWRA